MTFWSALILGLLASVHCAGMCGGLQAALQQPQVIRSPREHLVHLIALNLGRVCTYLIAGFIVAALGLTLLQPWMTGMASGLPRIAAATVLLLIGMHLLFYRYQILGFLEPLGQGVWRVATRLIPSVSHSGLRGSFSRGLLWAFLPCGLLYSVLIVSLFAENAVQGAAITAGFGLGTLPSMLLTGTAYLKLKNLIQHTGVRTVGGVFFVQGAVLMLIAPWIVPTSFQQQYPQLMTTFFCL